MMAETLAHKNIALRLYWVTQLTLLGLLGVHAFIYMLSPFESVYATLPAWEYLLFFWVVFALVSRVVLGRNANQSPDAGIVEWVSRITSGRLMKNLLVIAATGLCLHVYSKYYLTYYRPIDCVFEIRFVWLEISHNLLPWYVRIASVLGHLLSGFSYFGVFVASLAAMRSPELSHARWKNLLWLLVFMGIGMIYAGFIGSRNAMLAYLVMALEGVLFGICMQGSLKYSLRAAAITLILPVIMMTGFTAAVFSDRMFCHLKPFWSTSTPAVSNEGNTASTALQAAETSRKLAKNIQIYSEAYMQGYYDEFAIKDLQPGSYAQEWSASLATMCPTCGPMMLYLNHGIINFSQILASQQRGGPVLFTFFRNLPEKFGLAEPEKSVDPMIYRGYGPGGLPLAGAALHDFGMAGLLLIAIILGMIFGFALRLLNADGIALLVGVWLFITCFYILFLSPIFVGTNVISFPFLTFASGVTMTALVLAHRSKNTRIHFA